MKITKEKIDINSIDCKLIDLRHLLLLHWDYFKYTRDYVENNIYHLTHGYNQQAALVSAMIDIVELTQSMLDIFINNYEDEVINEPVME